MVNVWSMYGQCMVNVWSMYGQCMVAVWWLYDGCIVDVYATLCRLYGNSTAAALSGLSALCYPAGSVGGHTDNSARIATRQVRSGNLGAYTGDYRPRLLSRHRRQAVEARSLRGREQGESAACEREAVGRWPPRSSAQRCHRGHVGASNGERRTPSGSR